MDESWLTHVITGPTWPCFSVSLTRYFVSIRLARQKCPCNYYRWGDIRDEHHQGVKRASTLLSCRSLTTIGARTGHTDNIQKTSLPFKVEITSSKYRRLLCASTTTIQTQGFRNGGRICTAAVLLHSFRQISGLFSSRAGYEIISRTKPKQIRSARLYYKFCEQYLHSA